MIDAAVIAAARVDSMNDLALAHLDGLVHEPKRVQLVKMLDATRGAPLLRLTSAALRRHMVTSPDPIDETDRSLTMTLERIIFRTLRGDQAIIDTSLEILGEPMRRTLLLISIIRYNMVDVPTQKEHLARG